MFIPDTLKKWILRISGHVFLGELIFMLGISKQFARSFSAMDLGITEVAKDLLWIGVNDWDTREFHSMEAPVGTSYNSYLMNTDAPTVIDAVKYTLADQWIARLKTVAGNDLKGIKHIVMNHAEPDHSSGLPKLLEIAPHIEVICTKLNFETLSKFYDSSKWNVRIIKGGQPFAVGSETLTLAEIPMAHWPESGVTYWPARKVLFSNDAFGQHIASTKRFFDEVDPCLFKQEAKSYFANILMRHGKPVLRALKTAKSLPGIDMILPSHGVGFRRPEDIAMGIDLYTKWSNQTPKKKVSLIYDCNWFGTEKMAQAVAAGASKVKDVEIELFHARRTHITRTATEALDSAAIGIGSAVLHENILPDIAMHLQYLRCLNIKDKAGAIFGTYGWSPRTTAKEVRNQLFTPTKVQEVMEPIAANWTPSEEDFRKCEEMGRKLAEAAVAKVDGVKTQ